MVFLNDVIKSYRKDWYESCAVCASAVNCIDVATLSDEEGRKCGIQHIWILYFFLMVRELLMYLTMSTVCPNV